MDLGISVHNPGPDLAMLFLAIKLISYTPEEHGEMSLYWLAKNFLVDFERQGAVSLLCLQAMVLVALY
jgi:hypothetical protein